MTLHSRALYMKLTPSTIYLPRILVRYQACHVTSQLKISSLYLWLADQPQNRIQNLIGRPVNIHGVKFKVIHRSRDTPDTLRGFYLLLLPKYFKSKTKLCTPLYHVMIVCQR